MYKYDDFVQHLASKVILPCINIYIHVEYVVYISSTYVKSCTYMSYSDPPQEESSSQRMPSGKEPTDDCR